jgi:hypothetical protein
LIATLPGTAVSFVDNAASAASYKYTPLVSALVNYTYQIKAINAYAPNATGVGAVSAPLPVQTPMEFVAQPTGLTATPNATRTSVALSWTDNANNETAYLVEVSINGGTFSALPLITRTAAQRAAIAGTVSTNITTVPSNGYTFRITAINVTGSATSTSTPATKDVPAPGAPAAPTAPTGLVASLASATSVNLTWVDNANNETSYLVTIVRSTTTGSVTTTAVVNRSAAQGTATGGNVNYTAAVVAGSSYDFSVVAQTTRFGVTTPSTTLGPVTLNVVAPLAPTSVKAVAGGTGSQLVTVTWTDASSNETGFTVQRAPVTGGVVGAFANIGNVAAGVQTFADTTGRQGRVYQYQVRANGVVGNSAYVVASTVPVTAP